MKILIAAILTAVHLSLLAVSHDNSNEKTMAIEAFNSKNYQQAKQLFSQQEESAQRSFYLGKILLHEDDLDEAEEYFEDAVNREPNNAEYNYQFGAVSFQQAANASIFSAMGYASDGKKYHLKALELEPEHIPAMTGMIGFYSNAPSIAGGSMEKAEIMAKQLTKVDNKQGLIALLNLYGKQKDKSKSLKIAEQLSSKYTGSPKALFTSGLYFQSEEKYEKAIELFQNASILQVDEEKFYELSALYQVGRTAVISKANTKKGIEALEQYRVEIPKYQQTHKNLPGANWAAYRLAALYLLAGDKDNALSLAKQASKDDNSSLRKKAKKLIRKISGKR